MLSPASSISLAEMGRAGLEFAEQFEESQMLARFEEELRKLAAESTCEPPESAEPLISR
jgi:hypothetical protein